LSSREAHATFAGKKLGAVAVLAKLGDRPRARKPGKKKAAKKERSSKPGPRGLTLAAYKGALTKHAGILSLAAEELAVSREAVRQKIAATPALQEHVADIEERKMDLCDGQIVTLIKKGDPQTVRWYAERKGVKRGYGNKSEIEVRVPDEQLAGLVQAFGGDLSGLRKLRAAIEAPPSD
jgi:hypothetical protein